MASYFISHIILIVVASVQITVSVKDNSRIQEGCIDTCAQGQSGQYTPLCKSCKDYCYGTYAMKCNRGTEWNSSENKCVPIPSTTCKHTRTSTTSTTTSTTTTTTKAPISNEQFIVEDKSRREYKNETNIDRDSSSTHIASRKIPSNGGKLPVNPNKNLCPDNNDSTDDFLLKWIPCQYVLLMSGLLGLTPIIICLFCQMCRNRRNMRRKMLIESRKITVSTQTPEFGLFNQDSDSAIYDDLIPYERHEHGDRYTPLPYASSNKNTPGYYNSALLSMLEKGEADYSHDYLELLPGYTYLQLQDVETRKEVAHTLVPLIKDLCDKYKKDRSHYKDLDLQMKLDKCVKEV